MSPEPFQPKFDENGLLTAVVQDADNGDVLMVAFMNSEALQKTIDTGKAHYWSRSRRKLWMKGEESGHVQDVREMRFDCDQDAVVLKVRQSTAACHMGYRSCFYRQLKNGQLDIVDTRLFNPEDKYKKPHA
jgi:phosphoribosyl-AMP cyclohydrolase